MVTTAVFARFFALPNLAVLSALLLPATINAANIHLDGTNPNGSVTISWSDFEHGFTVNGTFYPPAGVAQSVSFTPTAATPRLSFSGTWIANSPSDIASATVNFVDPGTLHIRNQLIISG